MKKRLPKTFSFGEIQSGDRVKLRSSQNLSMNYVSLFPIVESGLPTLPIQLCTIISQYACGPSIASFNIDFSTTEDVIVCARLRYRYKLVSVTDKKGTMYEIDGSLLERVRGKMESIARCSYEQGSCLIRDGDLIFSGLVMDPALKAMHRYGCRYGNVCNKCLSLYLTKICALCMGKLTSRSTPQEVYNHFNMDVSSHEDPLWITENMGKEIKNRRSNTQGVEMEWDVPGPLWIEEKLYEYTLSLIDYSYTRELMKDVQECIGESSI